RTEPYDEQVIPYGNDIPKPYLDDLPPELSRWDRKPSPRPVLDPYQRYCYREGFVKPPRTHHCRILCLGLRSSLSLDWWVRGCSKQKKIVHHATAPDNPPGTPATFNTPTIDANLIALLVTSGLFCLFSTGMFFTHLHLLCRNASTVEWHTFSGMKEQERAVLSQVIPVCKCLGMDREGDGGLLGGRENNQPFRGNPRKELGLPSGFKGRRALRKRWDEEWGRIGKEGNLWW
ncbi:15612_t:CDS:2, partial [Acaulospora colombiana]